MWLRVWCCICNISFTSLTFVPLTIYGMRVNSIFSSTNITSSCTWCTTFNSFHLYRKSGVLELSYSEKRSCTVYHVKSLQLYKPLFHSQYKFKPNKTQAQGLRSECYSSYLYTSKYIFQNFWPPMHVLNLTQYEIHLKSIPTTISVMKLPNKVPLYSCPKIPFYFLHNSKYLTKKLKTPNTT